MGLLTCIRCGAKAEGDTFAQADELIDHAIGLSKGRPCSGDPRNMLWTGDDEKAETSTKSTRKGRQ